MSKLLRSKNKNVLLINCCDVAVTVKIHQNEQGNHSLCFSSKKVVNHNWQTHQTDIPFSIPFQNPLYISSINNA